MAQSLSFEHFFPHPYGGEDVGFFVGDGTGDVKDFRQFIAFSPAPSNRDDFYVILYSECALISGPNKGRC